MDEKGIGYGDDSVIDMVNNKRNITDKIKAANTHDIETYKGMIEGKVSMEVNHSIEDISKNEEVLKARQETKRKLKNKAKRDAKIKRWKAIGLTVLVGIGAAVTYGISQIPDFKNKVAEDSLNTVKTSIAESVDRPVDSVKVYNNSTMLSSNSAQTEYKVVIDNKIFYFRSENDGTTTNKIQDDIQNEDVLKAISDVSNAQNGTLVDSLRAKKTAEKIENGEMNLDMSKAMEEKSKDGFEIGD